MMAEWTREMATELAREQWREGWLDGRAMSLRLLRLELTVVEPLTRGSVLALVDDMLAGVEQDKASPGVLRGDARRQGRMRG